MIYVVVRDEPSKTDTRILQRKHLLLTNTKRVDLLTGSAAFAAASFVQYISEDVRACVSVCPSGKR